MDFVDNKLHFALHNAKCFFAVVDSFIIGFPYHIYIHRNMIALLCILHPTNA